MPLSFNASITRWKPSVSSLSPAGCVLSSVADIRLPPLGLVEIIGVLRHVLGQPQRVLASQLFRAIGIARFQRLDDVHVVVNRTMRAVLLTNGLPANHPHMR